MADEVRSSKVAEAVLAPVLNKVIEVADNASAAVMVAVDATKDAATATVQAGVNVGDQTLETAISEAEKLRVAWLESVKRIVAAVTKVI